MVEMFILSSPTLVIQHMPDIITKNQGWQIDLTYLLKNTPKEAFQKYTCSSMVSKVTTHMDFKVKFLQLLHKQVFTVH